jgi:hypothetical protein
MAAILLNRAASAAPIDLNFEAVIPFNFTAVKSAL